jgi:DNA polymerase-3 subunit delta'
VLCETPEGGLACGHCASCHWFGQGNHPDYREVVPEAAEEEAEGSAEGEAPREKARSVVIKVEQIRALASFAALTTHRAGHRVLVLHPAEAMHPSAANALLKTLEEPAPHTLIVLVSDRPARLPATLRSRCRRFVLGPPGREDSLAWLRAEGVADAGNLLALAGGAPLLAQRLAEPAEEQLRSRLVTELARPSGAHALQFAATLERGAVERFLFWLQTWVQDLARVRLSGRARHHASQAAVLATRARTIDLERLLDLDAELAAARALAGHPLNPRLLAEHLLMAYNRATLGAHP